MKFREINQLSSEELKAKDAELRKELMKLYAKVATGASPENSGRIKQIKKILARIKTTNKIGKK